MPLMYVSAFICGFVTASVMAMILAHIATSLELNAAHGALIGFMCWLGFAATTSYATALSSGKPKQLWLIDSAYNLVCFVLAGMILAVWR